MPTVPFEPDRFRTAAAHYLAGRTPYAPRLIARVILLSGLHPTHRVLDLGCGPGPLARAFAPHAAEVIGIDPEPAMLAAAAAGPPLANLAWRQGSSYDIGPELGAFHLVTMGRSFHWMDRADTLRRLDSMVGQGGCLALFDDAHPDLPENAWWRDYRALLERYGTASPMRTQRRAGTWLRHEAFLLDSAFHQLEEITIITRTRVSADTLVARALSMSTSTPSLVGERTEAMIADIRNFVASRTPNSTLPETVATHALLARRPDE